MKNIKKNKFKLKKIDKTKITLIISFLFIFFLYNYINFLGPNWIQYADEGVNLYLSHEYITEGSFTINNSLNEEFSTDVFTKLIYFSSKEVPNKPLGISLLITPIYTLEEKSPFFLISLICFLGVLFFYLFVKYNFGEKVALLSICFFAISSPQIFWSNFLVANFPAFSFFIGGIYFLQRRMDTNNRKFVITSAILFAVSSLLRYESAIFLMILFFILMISKIKLKQGKRRIDFKEIYLFLIVFILFISPMFYLNYKFYGHPLKINYGILTKADNLGDGGLFGFFKSMIIPYPVKIMSFSEAFSWIANNFDKYIIKVCVFFPFGIIGFLLLIKRRKVNEYIIAISLISVLWTLWHFSMYHWGWNTANYIISAYPRYLPITYATFSIFTAYTIGWIVKINKKMSVNRYIVHHFLITFILALIFLTHFLSTFWGLFGDGNAFKSYEVLKRRNYELNRWLKSISDKSVIISSYYVPRIIEKPVLDLKKVPGIYDKVNLMLQKWEVSLNQEGLDNLSKYIFKLNKKGYKIYIIECAEHKKSYLNIAKILEGKIHLKIKKIKNYSDRRRIIYRIEM